MSAIACRRSASVGRFVSIEARATSNDILPPSLFRIAYRMRPSGRRADNAASKKAVSAAWTVRFTTRSCGKSGIVRPGRQNMMRLVHPENALFPMVCSPSGKTTEAKLLHSQNALLSDGLQPCRKGHRGQTTAPSNAYDPMVCNASGKTTEAKLLHQRMHRVRWSATHPERPPRPNYCTHRMPRLRWSATHPERPPRPNYCTHRMHTLRWSATHPERPPRPNYCTLRMHCSPMVCNASGKATEAKLLHP